MDQQMHNNQQIPGTGGIDPPGNTEQSQGTSPWFTDTPGKTHTLARTCVPCSNHLSVKTCLGFDTASLLVGPRLPSPVDDHLPDLNICRRRRGLHDRPKRRS